MNWWWHTEADTVETADRDVLALDGQLAAGTHAVITTPGATRFYRSDGETAIAIGASPTNPTGTKSFCGL